MTSNQYTALRSLGVLAVIIVAAGFAYRYFQNAADSANVYRFANVAGPVEKTVVPPEAATPWTQFDHGGSSRLAILLTDTNSEWLSLALGLKTIGVPFRITRDYREAIKHKAVLVYPTISGSTMDAAALQAIAQFARERGTLIGSHVLGGGMNEVFGFDEAIAGKRSELRFDITQPLATAFTDERERTIRIGNPAKPSGQAGSYSYTNPRNPPLAIYEDGSAAVTQKQFDNGRAYALGIDLGFLLTTGYTNREDGVARNYVNGFEPSLDVLLRLIKGIVIEANPQAVTLATVPAGKSLAVVMSHDIDYTRSLKNALTYATFEKEQGIAATHFIQVKYIKDWNDDIFFNTEGATHLKTLQALGVEIGSHSVSHSRSMNAFPLGSGTEQYPGYQPFVKSQDETRNGTILGELRVSKFLLDTFTPGGSVTSFRPGHLRNPYALPQALQATGYRYSSSVTANNSLTHLPFQLTHSRASKQALPVFEFPVTVEDEAAPKLGERLNEAINLAQKISRYGGTFVALIHTDVLDHKLEFERGFVAAVKPYAWFGAMRDFGAWWSARNQVECDVENNGLTVRLSLPEKISGLTLNLPADLQLAAVEPADIKATQQGSNVVIDSAQGAVTLTLTFTRSK